MIKRLLPAVLALTVLVAAGVARAAGDGGAVWLTDYAQAMKESKATGKPILADFTGSDWCGWCIKLSKETFSQPEFAAFAKDNVILLEVDFPQGKEQTAAVKKQNEGLQKKFGVEGFPTIVLIGKDGKEIARNDGYLAGGPSAMIAWVKESVAKH
jgi:protein disulfide-isomerase